MKSTTRQNFLKASGVSLALPHLTSLFGDKKEEPKKRFICVHQCLGWEAEAFFPKDYGKDIKLSPTLEPLSPFKDRLTVFNGMEHGVTGGHYAEHAFLTGVHLNEAKKFKEGNISVDIKAAEHVGLKTRFPSLHLALPGGVGRYDRTSWTRSSISVPMESNLEKIFNQLFVDQTAEAKKRQFKRLQQNTSIIDAVLKQSHAIQPALSQEDTHSLDQFYTSIRETEKKLSTRRAWINSDKPKEDMPEYNRQSIKEVFPLYYKLMSLALKNDSTRVISLQLPVTNQVYHELDVTDGLHLVSHHGKSPTRLKQLRRVENYHFSLISNFLKDLEGMQENGTSLVDLSTVLVGAGMGNGSAHANRTLPSVVIGGGLKHGGHRDMRIAKQPRPLCDLFLSLLQNFGLEIDSFAKSRSAVTWS